MKDYLPYIISAIMGGGFLSGVYALLKLRPEAGQITVTAAQGALIVQTGVIESLREELQRLAGEIQELRQELEAERKEKENLRIRIKDLENK